MKPSIAILVVAASVATAGPAVAQTEEELALALANPIASLISIPFQNNWDGRIGPVDDGHQYRLNVQPVIPISLSSDWNLITRWILPVVRQSEVFPGAGTQSGIGDLLVSFFFSPVRPTSGGWIWGAGPVVLAPTGSDPLLTADRWAAGPTGVVLRQQGAWTIGMLGNHLWSVGGSSSRPDINASFLQPFASFNAGGGWSYTVQAEATYDWDRRDASIPVGAFVGKVMRVGGLPVQFNVGPRYYVANTDAGAKGWSLRFTAIVMLPR